MIITARLTEDGGQEVIVNGHMRAVQITAADAQRLVDEHGMDCGEATLDMAEAQFFAWANVHSPSHADMAVHVGTAVAAIANMLWETWEIRVAG